MSEMWIFQTLDRKLLLSRVQVKSSSTMAGPDPALPDSFTPSSSSVYSDQFGFYSLDRNVPGLSKVILDKLKMKDYKDYR